MVERVDHLIIGGGIYGIQVALAINKAFPSEKVVLMESETSLLARASSNNQTNLHRGHQYSLHPQTAVEANKNAERFLKDYGDCVNGAVRAYYGIHVDSQVSPQDYERFCATNRLTYTKESNPVAGLFGGDVVAVYLTDEKSIAIPTLQKRLREQINLSGVDVRLDSGITSIAQGDNITLTTRDEQVIEAGNVFNCSYSGINNIHLNSGLPLVPTTHNKIALFRVAMPETVKDINATVIYGPYAALTTAKGRGETHLLAHVRHSKLNQEVDITKGDRGIPADLESSFEAILESTRPYLPVVSQGVYLGEKIEIRSATGVNTQIGDRRTQTFPNYGGLENYHVVFGGKVHCFYEAVDFALKTLGKNLPADSRALIAAP